MKNFWKTMNIVYEKTVLAVLVVALLIVIYSAYDTWYVFDQATDDSYLMFRPDRVNAAELDDSGVPSDMVAWITVDDTNIDYPVMQGEDNARYLNLDPNGEYSLSGSIFLDSRNAPDFTDPYSVIYGHHMEYGKMFGALDNFLDDQYLSSHRTGTLIVGRGGEQTYSLEIFYAMTADAKDEMVFAPEGNEELRQFLEQAGYTRSDRIICLSTCAGDASTTRTVVFAYILEN